MNEYSIWTDKVKKVRGMQKKKDKMKSWIHEIKEKKETKLIAYI